MCLQLTMLADKGKKLGLELSDMMSNLRNYKRL